MPLEQSSSRPMIEIGPHRGKCLRTTRERRRLYASQGSHLHGVGTAPHQAVI